MALPDRLPEPPDDFETTQHADARPSWLVGAEEGAQSEIERDGAERPDGAAPARPTLTRPAGADRVGLPLESRPAAAPPRPVAWTAAGNSIPRLTQVPEIERRAHTDADAGPEDPIEGLSDDTPHVADLGRGPAVAPPPPLAEPWWVVLGERLAGDRRLLIMIGAALVIALGTFLLWPRPDTTVRVREIQRHPDRWEGRSVRVDGRIGDVFPIGSGYVFQLHQGRDTIVVFTRSRTPERRQRVTVAGEVSAGYLDGRARLAILEHTAP